MVTHSSIPQASRAVIGAMAVWAVCGLCRVGASAESAASQPAAKPSVVVVVGDDGRERILIGRILEQDAEHIVVERPAGRLPVARAQVRAIYSDLTVYYEKRRREIDAREPEEHVRLARWCLSNGLREQAKEELELALLLHPGHHIAQTMLDSITKLSGPKQTAKRRPARHVWSRDQLFLFRRWKAGQTKACLEKFNTRVQRILVNSCWGMKCHGPTHQSSGFRLERWGPDRRFSERRTLANLQATFSVLDVDDPLRSALLTKPQLGRDEPPTHAGGRIFVGERQKLLKVLRDWLGMVRPPLPKPGAGQRPKRTSQPKGSQIKRLIWRNKAPKPSDDAKP